MFLFSKVQETIAFKEYIKEVEMGYEYDETYGNSYVRLFYNIKAKDAFDELPYSEQEKMFRGNPNHTFSVSTHTEYSRDVESRELLGLIAFRHIYGSLASYAILQFEQHLNKETTIKVQEIDLWPHANYAEKYFYTGLSKSYFKTMHVTHDEDIWQWKRLHQLNKDSRQIYLKDKINFSLTDIELNRLPWIHLSEVRSMVLRYNVPIRVKGMKTIDEILIHAPRLAEALKKELGTEYVGAYHKNEYQALIAYLYDGYLPDEKARLVEQQQSDFLKRFIIQQGDILELEDQRIVIADAVSIDPQYNVNVSYSILKTDLQISQRSRTINIAEVRYVVQKHDFLNYLDNIPRKYLSLLKKWMLPRKKEVIPVVFKPDFTRS